jgi:YVTN family beta-propeller protein
LKRTLCVVLISAGLTFGCSARTETSRPVPAEGGTVVVYLQRLPQAAERLEFRLGTVSVLADGGPEVPLDLRLRKIEPRRVQRQRLLATGSVPPGSYAGLAVRAERATLEGPDGASELQVSQAPSEITVPFSLRKGQAVVIVLELRYRESVDSGFRFDPAFVGRIPGKLATGLIGVASSRAADVVTVFDKLSGEVAAVVPTRDEPVGLALDATRQRIYVAAYRDDVVQAIDLLDHAVIDRVQLGAGDRPLEIALTPDGTTLLTANSGTDTVSFIDAVDLFEIERVAVGRRPRSILIDRDGRRAYVFSVDSNTIAVLDIPRRVVAATITTESGPVRGEFNRGGDRLFVLHESSPNLSVIDPATLSTETGIYVGTGGTALEIDPRTDRIYLARRGTGTVEIFDPLSLLPIATIPVDGDVAFLQIDPEGNNLGVVLSDLDEIRMVRLVNDRTVARTDVGPSPFQVVFVGER